MGIERHFFAIVRSAGASNMLLVTFLIPATSILLGTLFLGESLITHQLWGMLGIALALLIVDGRLLRVHQARASI